MEKIFFKVDGDNLFGTILYPSKLKDKNPAVLFVHGWTSSQKSYIPRAEAVSKCGAICMTFNLRGHGDSGGNIKEFSRKDHLKDVIKAYDFLVSLSKADKNKIGVVGASYGGYLSSILISKRKVKWFVLRAPALYKDNDFNTPTFSLNKEDVRVYRQSKINPKNNYALKALTRFKNEVVLIECEKDSIVPKQTIQNYEKALKNNKNYSYILLSKADHELSTEEFKKAFIDILLKVFTNWFKKDLLNS